MDFLLNPFITILALLYSLFGNNIVLAITALTVVIRLATSPLLLQQQRSNEAMQVLQPQITIINLINLSLPREPITPDPTQGDIMIVPGFVVTTYSVDYFRVPSNVEFGPGSSLHLRFRWHHLCDSGSWG